MTTHMRQRPTAPRDRLVVALDFPGRDSALGLVERLGDAVSMYKVGKQLFTSVGPEIVRHLMRSGRRVFLDLKFHDIPNTVAGAISAATALGVSLVNVHAAGGEAMLQAAARAAVGSETAVLAVTVLTSLDQQQLQAVGFHESPEALVLRLARLALECGVDGVIAAPTEIALLRRELGSDFLIATLGVRLDLADRQDQSRVGTPAHGRRDGDDYIGVGRPITQAPDPPAVVSEILKMLE